MKKVDIQEYNALCAQFWGLKHGWWIHQEKPLTDDKKQWCNISGKNFLGSRAYYNKDLLFHEDWSWIMNTLEKIESLGGGYFMVENNKAEILVKISEKRIFQDRIIGNYKKEAIIETIYLFLKWYLKK